MTSICPNTLTILKLSGQIEDAALFQHYFKKNTGLNIVVK